MGITARITQVAAVGIRVPDHRRVIEFSWSAAFEYSVNTTTASATWPSTCAACPCRS